MATKGKEVEVIDFLKYLTKLGASKVIVDLYKRYNVISCSPSKGEEKYTEPYEFTAREGIPWEWVKKVIDLERNNNISVYHILYGEDSLGTKLSCLYYNNTNINSYYNLLNCGQVSYFNYYPDLNLILWYSNEYKIEGGKIELIEPKTYLVKKEGGKNNEFISKGSQTNIG